MAMRTLTPQDKDRMLVEIDELRRSKSLTLPDAAAEWGKKNGKTASATKALYQYWKSTKRKEALGEKPKKYGPGKERVQELAANLAAAVNAQTPNKAPSKNPAPSGRRAMLERLLNMNERILQEILNEENTADGADSETES